MALTKKAEAALREELAECRKRAREITAILNPTSNESETLAYLRAVRGPCKGSEIAKALGKRQSNVVDSLSRAVISGKAIRVGVGEYQAVSQ